MSASADLFNAAVVLDESPVEMLNGGAAEGLRALEASAGLGAELAVRRNVDPDAIHSLWDRAATALRRSPDGDELFPTAADAAVLLYAAAWFLGADDATTAQREQLL
jgi:hypothetical protein